VFVLTGPIPIQTYGGCAPHQKGRAGADPDYDYLDARHAGLRLPCNHFGNGPAGRRGPCNRSKVEPLVSRMEIRQLRPIARVDRSGKSWHPGPLPGLPTLISSLAFQALLLNRKRNLRTHPFFPTAMESASDEFAGTRDQAACAGSSLPSIHVPSMLS
jgi:hypothetical protein